ncbi:MAG: glycosyltransferase [Lachnospiraceae bacterium]|nr:glycosyltransferase [Lachnospiraceae bacterium]
MIVTQLSLAEYFDLIVERATYGGYKWVIMFIGRKAEAEKIYNEIENCWASLNDLTNNRIAFVFSASIHIRDNSFYKFPHQEPYRGRMCPFARIVGKDTFRDNVGDFEYLCHHFQSYNWKELHTQSITEFIEKNEIRECDLPGLFVYNVYLRQTKYIQLKDEEGIYSLLRNFTYKSKQIDDLIENSSRKMDDNKVKAIFDLEEAILKYANDQSPECKNLLCEFLASERDYKSCKDLICNKDIRKKLENYERRKHRLNLNSEEYLEKKEEYIADRKEYEKNLKRLSQWMSDDFTIGEVKKDKEEKAAKEDGGSVTENYTFVFIIDDWGYSKGGINVFNKLLCEAMSRLAHSKVVCVVQNVSADKERQTTENGIEILYISKENNNEKIIAKKIMNITCKDSKIIFVGHDVQTGEMAIKCKKRFLNSKCIIIHHMAYAEYYPILNMDYEVSEAKENLQREILQQADMVFTNGATLEKSAQDIVGDEVPVFRIYPGVSEVEPRKNINNTFKVVTFGRIEQGKGLKKNNTIIKETYLALAAWADFTKKYCREEETIMKIYGKNGDDNSVDKEMEELLKQYSDKVYAVSIVPYMENRKQLLTKLSEFSLCLVLSLREGFGLTALEAVSAGVPLIVSKRSGFYKSLEELRLDNYVYGVDIQGKRDYPYYSDTDLENTSNAIYSVFRYQQDAKNKTIELRERLKNCGFTWKQCAKTIIEKVTENWDTGVK